jgi:hypothetical protein
MCEIRTKEKEMKGWIGVDLDGTLAHYDEWRGPFHIGPPVPAMVARVKQWLRDGIDVRIFTARVDGGEAALLAGDTKGHLYKDVNAIKGAIRHWCVMHIGVDLPITNVKDYAMAELWDDRCVRVEKNTGVRISPSDYEEVL